jgi:hypothetical protein
MTFWEAFRSAWGGVSAHKLRSGLTMLGIMFGRGGGDRHALHRRGRGRQAQA